jgi:hypothetical protein
MKKNYQRKERKSNHKFEVVRGQECWYGRRVVRVLRTDPPASCKVARRSELGPHCHNQKKQIVIPRDPLVQCRTEGALQLIGCHLDSRVTHRETKFPVPHGGTSRPGGRAVLPRPKASIGTVVTSPNGLAALARMRSAGFRAVAGTAEYMAHSRARSLCGVCSLRRTGGRVNQFDHLVYFS